MMEKIWNPEGPVMGFLEKCGQLIVLSVLWLLGCLPIVTVCTSNAALYYAVMKSVRRGQGSAVREFWRSYRMNLLGGSILTILFAAAAAALMALSYRLSGGMYPVGVAGIGWILILFVFSYIGPVLSRFRIGIWKTVELAFVMSLQYAHYTLVFLLGASALVLGFLFLFPMAAVLILPGFWCWTTTFLMEKALQRYMPPMSQTDDSWYYEHEEG